MWKRASFGHLSRIVLCAIVWGWATLGSAETYRIDRSPLDRYRDLAKPYLDLQAAFEKGPLSEEEHRQRLAVLRRILQEDPSWVDGYGLFAGEAFMLASSFHDPAEYDNARKLLDDSVAMSEQALALQSRAVLSQFFLAAALAKKAALNGVMSSLRLGSKIHSLWQEVMRTGQEVWLRPNVSLQGSVRYGLGIFYRLVPDQWMMQRLFSIRGNLDRSIRIHRDGLALNPQDPCASLMLAAALLCQARQNSALPEEASELLQRARRMPSFDRVQTLCQSDASRIQQDPTMACHYTQS